MPHSRTYTEPSWFCFLKPNRKLKSLCNKHLSQMHSWHSKKELKSLRAATMHVSTWYVTSTHICHVLRRHAGPQPHTRHKHYIVPQEMPRSAIITIIDFSSRKFRRPEKPVWFCVVLGGSWDEGTHVSKSHLNENELCPSAQARKNGVRSKNKSEHHALSSRRIACQVSFDVNPFMARSIRLKMVLR